MNAPNMSLATVVTLLALAGPASSANESPAVIPELEITSPTTCLGITPADVPPISTFRWRASDGTPDPAEVRYILLSTAPFGNSYAQTIQYIRTNPDSPDWSTWETYAPPDVGTSWTTPPLEYGDYVFAVHGRDSEGNTETLFVEPRNIRRIKIAPRVSGPLLTVTSPYHDPIVTSMVAPTVQIEVVSDTPVTFCWTADAFHYGGTVEGYRYAWDLTDPDDDSQWGMPFTPFATAQPCVPPQECLPAMAVIPYGSHVFYVEVIDNSGYKSRASIEVTWRQSVGAPQPWSRRYGDVSIQHSKGVAVDDASNVVVVGEFSGTFSFGGGPLTGSNDLFLAMVNRFGTHLWSKKFTGAGNEVMRDVAVDASGAVSITGHFLFAVDFGGGVLTPVGNNDVFLAKYDANGTHLWSQRFGGLGEERAAALAVDGAGNVVLTGEIYMGSANFGGGNLPAGLYVAKFTPAGGHVWSRSVGGNFNSFADVDVDAQDNTVLGGPLLWHRGFRWRPVGSCRRRCVRREARPGRCASLEPSCRRCAGSIWRGDRTRPFR